MVYFLIAKAILGKMDTGKTFLQTNLVLDLIYICKLKPINNYRQAVCKNMNNRSKIFYNSDCTEKK